MNKFGIVFVIVATLVVALMSTGYVFAQGTTPPTPQTPGSGYGYGRGGMMGGLRNGGGMVGEGILHNTLISIFAQKLSISTDDLNARLANGETMAQIASSKGLTAEQFTALMSDARTQAIDQAVKDGTLTQAQADWMKTRSGATGSGGATGSSGATRSGGRMGTRQGNAGAGRGMRGAGTGTPSTCPYFPQTNQ